MSAFQETFLCLPFNLKLQLSKNDQLILVNKKCPYQQGSLEKLIQMLHSLNGSIKDPRAAFMDRTKVGKNIVVRDDFIVS